MFSSRMNLNQAKTDRSFFWTVGAIILAVSIVPFLFGWSLTPVHYHFYGNSLLSPADPSVYYAYIEQGRLGHIFMYDAFTSEPQRAILWQPVWWAVGLLARLFHLSTVWAFALARWASIPLLLSVLWWAVRWISPDQLHRRVSLGLATFGAGVGGIIIMIWPHWVDFSTRTSPDLWVSEAYIVLSALTNAHFLLVTTGLLFTMVSVERAAEEGLWRRIGWAGLVLLITLSIHPFHAMTLILLWSMMTAARWIRSKRFPAAYVQRWMAALFMASPALIYYGLQLLTDPLVAGRAAQNINLMTSPIRTVIGLGLFVPLAILGYKRHRGHDKQLWLAVWAAAALIAVYLPVSFQRRLSQGMIIPFALLSANIVADWWRKKRKTPAVYFSSIIVASSLFFFSPFLVVISNMNSYIQERTGPVKYLYYLPPEYDQLSAYLKKNTAPNEPILAAVTPGRTLASLTAHQVFLGYSVETVDFNRKFDQMKAFYGSMSIDDQRHFLVREHLCYILSGPYEQAYGQAFHPSAWSNLQLIWQGPTMSLYQRIGC